MLKATIEQLSKQRKEANLTNKQMVGKAQVLPQELDGYERSQSIEAYSGEIAARTKR